MSKMLPWSYSKLSLYEKCPAQAKARYLDKLQTPKSAQASRGTDAHATVENYLLGKSEDLHEVAQPYAHVFARIRERKPVVEYKIAFRSDWTLTEWDKCWGRAVLDCAYIEGDHVEIQEWKTGKEYSDHADQRRLYVALSSVQWPQAAHYRIQTYYLDLGKKRVLKLDAEEIAEVKEEFTARAKIMELDDVFAPRPGHYCRWCPCSRLHAGGTCKVG